MRTPYVNRLQSSNAAAHVLRSDAYAAGLAGLLDLHWQLPGSQPDYSRPI